MLVAAKSSANSTSVGPNHSKGWADANRHSGSKKLIMSYTPSYSATFSKPLLNQLIAIIQRDQSAALQLVNPGLSPINEFHKGPGMRTAFPWLALAVDSTKFDGQALGTRKSTTRVILALDVGQFDQDMAQESGQDYARVLDMVITSAPLEDFMSPLPILHQTAPGGLTIPPEAGSVKEVFIVSHSYGLVTLKEVQMPVLRVTLDLQFELDEI